MRSIQFSVACLLLAALSVATPSCSSGDGEQAEVAEARSGPGRGAAAGREVTDVLEGALRLAAPEPAWHQMLEPRGDGFWAQEGRYTSAGHREAEQGAFGGLGVVMPERWGEATVGLSRVARFTLTLSPVGAHDAAGSLDGGRLVYRDAYRSTDVIAVSTESMVEWFFVLRDPGAPSVITWDVGVGRGLVTTRRDEALGGALEFVDALGEPVIRVLPARAIDARGVRRDAAVDYRDGKLVVSLDQSGLTYPVLLDPVAEVPLWQKMTPSTKPASRHGPIMFDSTNASYPTVYLFGGTADGKIEYNDLWGWDGTNWAEKVLGTKPAKRQDAACAGGFAFGGYSYGSGADLNDTWELGLVGPQWYAISPATKPSARYQHAMAALSTGEVVLFGGRGGGVNLQDTWVFDSTNDVWSQKSPATKPAARRGHAMAANVGGSSALLFGGTGSSSYDTTWVWSGTAWSQKTPASKPSAREGHRLVRDLRRDVVVLFGGSGTAPSDETWEWTGSTWKQMQPATRPSARRDHAMAWDGSRKRVVLFGGSVGGDETWTYYVRGGDCAAGADCDTGYCVDGTCCESQNCGTCEACNTAAKPGQCATVTNAEDDSCNGTKMCGPTGACGLDNGQNCAQASACASGFCSTEGKCCNEACTGDCNRCDGATQGWAGAVNGVCAVAPAGYNPGCGLYVCNGSDAICPGSCSNDAGCDPGNYCNTVAGKCTAKLSNGAACSASNQCTTGFCVDGYCCNNACSNKCDTCAKAGSLGTCTPAGKGAPGAPTCEPYLCGTGVGCASSCTVTTDCAAGYFCTGGQCKAQTGLGQACSAQPDCPSGLFCVEGVCCNDACAGECRSCRAAKTGAPEGACANVLADTDPDNECAQDASTTCQKTGACDGGGKCAVYADGTPCGAGTSCSGNLETTYKCNGVGACVATSTTSCLPYSCAGSTCASSCASNAECSDTTFCSLPGGTCVPKVGLGEACSTTAECGAGTCASGVCCSSPCAGGCERCDLVGAVGTCSPLAVGASPEGCPAESDAYLCPGGVGACPVSCLSDEQCAPGNYCGADSKCKPKKPAGASCNAGVGGDCQVSGCGVCSSGFCVDGVCCDTACEGACDVCNKGGSVGVCAPADAGVEIDACSPYKCGGGVDCATTCTTDGDCRSTHTCAAGACVQKAGLGNPCAGNSDCTSGFVCVDSVCCENDCTGECKACSAAKKGQGADGFCGNVVALTDPDNECAEQDAATCKLVGTCDGNGACAKHPKGTPCGNVTTCAAGVQTAYQCDGNGSCDPATSTKCDPFGCSGSVCANACTSNGDCFEGAFCDTATGSCKSKLSVGTTCSASTDCANGQCVDGFCCDKPCSGLCFACSNQRKGFGDDGVCEPIKLGADPDNECSKDPVSTCKQTGACDGQGSCELYAEATPCKGTPTCVGGSAVGFFCDVFNECSANSVGVACAPYLCQDGIGCLTTCASDAECIAEHHCGGGVCSPRKALGDSCTTDGECKEGHCADGVCCDTACGGQCEACNEGDLKGKCSPVVGAPRKPREACKGEGEPCGGSCDGKKTATCTYAGDTTPCPGAACESGVFSPKVCDGDGACVDGKSQSCSPFACGADGCKKTCVADADCANGAACDRDKGECALVTNTCADDFTSVASDGAQTSCVPYRCKAGACLESCAGASDCAQGFTCKSGKCAASAGAGGAGGAVGAGSSGAPQGAGAGVAQGGGSGGASSGAVPTASEAPAAEEGGCGCEVAGAPTTSRSSTFVAVALLGLVARRSRRRHS